MLTGQPEPPKYFATMKKMNKEGPRAIGPSGHHGRPTLDEVLAQGGLVVDTRTAEEFADSHRHGVINIPLNGSFVTWAGWLIPYDRDFSVITDRIDDVRRALSLIGLDRIAADYPTFAGRGGASVSQLSAAELAPRLPSVTVVDVRGAAEWATGHLPGATHIPLGYLAERAADIPAGRPIVVQCQSGGRSAIAASLLGRLGVANVVNLTGGITAWAAAGLPIESGAHETQAARA